jgi:hypothetical protein
MRYLKHVFDRARWHFLWAGCARRLSQKKSCPCCGAPDSTAVDRKLVYTLEQCQRCRIRYRFPYESAEEMHRYYQDEYQEEGLTDLPAPHEIEELVARNFAGGREDFSRVIDLLGVLGLEKGARVLDYGANWGYGTFQLRRAGFAAEGYEISRPRARFGKRLGIEIAEDLAFVPKGFDGVYSSHVLEHTPNPLEALRGQLGLTRDGGFVIAHTPNGSEAFRRADFRAFHRLWGLPHPVLLSGDFIRAALGAYPCFVSSDAGQVRGWGRRDDFVGDLTGPELLIVICNRPKDGAAAVPYDTGGRC